MRTPSMRTFSRNDCGAITIVFAVAIAALIGAIALAIDLGRAYSVRSAIGGAADAAALSAAISNGTGVTQADRWAMAQRYFAANFRNGTMGVQYDLNTAVDYSEAGDIVTVQPSGFLLDKFFAQGNGEIQSLRVSNRSRVQKGFNSREMDYDIHFIADASSSMNETVDGSRKISQLIRTLQRAVDRIGDHADKSSANIALSKYNTGGAVGFFCEGSNWGDSGYGYDIFDNKAKCHNYHLHTQVILDKDRNRFDNIFNNVLGDLGEDLENGTCPACGLVDSFHVADKQGRADVPLIVVLLSDGVTNLPYPKEDYAGYTEWYETYGDYTGDEWEDLYDKCVHHNLQNQDLFPANMPSPWRDQGTAPLNCQSMGYQKSLVGSAQMLALCNRFKERFANRSVKIYTIGYGDAFLPGYYDAAGGLLARDSMTACATSPDFFLTVQNEDQLDNAFQGIIGDAQKLRIVE